MTDHTEANALAIANMHLVKQMAVKLKATMPSFVDCEDLEGAGYLGLIQASRSFDVTRGVKFRTYARRRIRGQMFDWLRRDDWVPRLERARLKREGLPVPVAVKSIETVHDDPDYAGHVVRLRHMIASQHPGPEHDVDIADFWTAPLPELDDVETRILQMYYRDGMTQRQIGAILGFSESRANQILVEIRRRHAS
jgi:RNA polymerase sigma factor for flagellar operon FliA